jgi:uncharacterized protein
VLPLEKVVGLEARDETVQDSSIIEGLEMDIVSGWVALVEGGQY